MFIHLQNQNEEESRVESNIKNQESGAISSVVSVLYFLMFKIES